ncbi:hypothetical protein FNJ88_11075 [Chryseobacterium sp. SNU WT5]|uniref:hypothetical protein n=1 Tax=Chryseobacterium sp. SNU WT5 TaxID=2594269 RepID=UPI0011804561|nr:hypothetical protein [Chryseobacterium sp. SNU WT5]QDP86061.1 hypothetical protein FNJ88_11075 [Chryseobacterium sp. SNU WT5]
MKIEELRLGNIIHVDTGFHDFGYKKGTHVIDKRLLIDILTYSTLQKCIKAVPVTEEWLLKFGFKRFPWGLVIGELLFKDNLKCTELTFEVGNGFRVELKYVHHLQNFYFDFNNEELKQQ